MNDQSSEREDIKYFKEKLEKEIDPRKQERLKKQIELIEAGYAIWNQK